ncbi:hypothetical protein MQE36_16665 [Zhouia spongiae]|uniref:Uncharacterized protein n=1 Tax=Zhouia spongiae TaxID=2202721 RepID=A0ABY3YLI9_9FLAO|nr:hypothetical protein [Zhouia spongiae]UNY98697.1 hypothetical protein MQE36_16665 [Zhouia spongiae]
MMDELDLLKKDWKSREKDLPRLSHDEIYKMIWKKSSSNIKWIFIISALEFLLGLLITIFYHPASEEFKLPGIVDILTKASMLVAIYFMVKFYLNYKKVSAASTVKGLLHTIMKARKTVKTYIITMMSFGGIAAVIAAIYTYINQRGGWEEFNETAHTSDYLLILLVSVVATVIILGIFLLIYFLLYGILMRRLKKNYSEIKKIEV